MWRENMKNINEEDEEEEDTWELARAFDEDTRTTMGTNWPPRSYTCTFCRREFRSAQALGGHMNIHRRDRARQAQAQSQAQTTVVGSTSSSESLISWANLGGGSGAIVYNYQLANYGANDSFGGTNYSPNNDNYEMKITEMSNYEENYGIVKLNKEEVPVEELDLELRLGHTPVSDGRLMKKKNNNNVAVLHWR